MAETTLSTRRVAPQRDGDTNGARSLRRRRGLPGGRAVVGGFLVALAAVGVFAGYTSATADTSEPYLVARHDLALGHRISRDDLGTLPIDLPALLQSKAYRDPALLEGAVVIGAVAKGELVQSSNVLAGTGTAGDSQISFSIESARAVNGQLRRGEFVDVLATYGTGTEGYTAAVVRGARVADRSEARSALSDNGSEVITLALSAEADTLAVAHAVSSGSIMLVRAAGPPVAGGDDDAASVYRPRRTAAGEGTPAVSVAPVTGSG